MGHDTERLTARQASTPVIISDINFVDDIDQYLETTTGIESFDRFSSMRQDNAGDRTTDAFYSVGGYKTKTPGKGIFVRNGQKLLLP